MEGFVPVASFTNVTEAELAKTTLEAAGIEAFLKYEDTGGMIPGLQFTEGVELLVDPSNLEEAKTLLSQPAIGENPPEPAP